MFTGLVEEVGTVRSLELANGVGRLTVEGPVVVSDAALGSSIAVNGVCLTVAELDGTGFSADVMAATLAVTTLGSLKAGARVNLERALRLDQRLGGHIVQGHVDGVAKLLARRESENWHDFDFELPATMARYVAPKGSIAIDGVSLTVAKVGEGRFTVSLIPTTLVATTLGGLAQGASVNLELDVIAKYVERLVA
jgi:riboflavin synthase